MLLNLHIENVAIIKNSDIDFSEGFIVLTGETGAGKSIIIDSVNLLLGNKSSRDLISSDSDYAFVSGTFTGFNDSQLDLLSEQDVVPDDDGNVIISRKITKDSRSVSKINGVSVSVTTLKNIASVLVSIHGQHDGSKILNSTYHIEYLDEYCGIADKIQSYREKYSCVKGIRKRIEELNEIIEKREQLEDSLKFKINEIEKADIKEGEYEALKKSKISAENSALINGALYNSEMILTGDDSSLLTGVSTIIDELTSISKIVNGVEKNLEMLNKIKAELEDVSEFISRQLSIHEENDLSPDYIEERLYTIDKILKKYNTESEALSNLQSFKDELLKLEDNEAELELATKEYASALEELEKSAQKLSELRHDSAKILCHEIGEQLKELDMPNVRFEVDITRSINARGGNKYTLSGYDNVEFCISPNAGQQPKPVSKISSGGEMSRIMLCLKTILNGDKAECNTVIYDEIDTGVSGSTAQKIGYKLKAFSKHKQVFCVTHLAQIAALADHHYKVEKTTENDLTRSNIKLLNDSERRIEVARIMGGVDITDQLIKSADELIKTSGKM